MNKVSLKKLQGWVSKARDTVKVDEFSKTKTGAIIVTGLGVALFVIDALYDFNVIFG